MGVNLFAPINKVDARNENISRFITKANSYGNDDNDPYNWVGLFEGEDGFLLSMEKALAFTEDEAPWFVLFEGTLFYCHPDASSIDVADWREILRISDKDSVIFMKVRN